MSRPDVDAIRARLEADNREAVAACYRPQHIIDRRALLEYVGELELERDRVERINRDAAARFLRQVGFAARRGGETARNEAGQ